MTNDINIFFETTVQIARLSGINEKVMEVNKVIKREFQKNPQITFYSSSIVYAEFLRTIIIDILIIRDLLITTFLKNRVFLLNFSEIDNALADSLFIRPNRVKRLFIITSALKRKFQNVEELETKRIILFLDTIARDLAFRDFFSIEIGGVVKKIDLIDEKTRNGIECLVDHPLQSFCGEALNENLELLRRDVYKFDESKKLKEFYFLDINAPITKCDGRNPNNNCGLVEFLNRPEITFILNKLIQYAVSGGFSLKFMRKERNQRLIKLLQSFSKKGIDDLSILKGGNCLVYLTDLLVVFQCPDNTKILSYDTDFDELGKLVGRPEIRLVPQNIKY